MTTMVPRALAFGFACATWACGSASVLSSSDELPGEFTRPAAVKTLAGAANVSDVPGFEPSFESQTAAAVLGGRVYIAYRAGDASLVEYVPGARGHEDQRICAGASELAFSTGSPASHTYRRVRIDPPPGVAVLSGPVATTAFAGAAYFSALASPEDRFAAVANDGGCLRLSQDRSSKLPASLAEAGALAGACITSVPGYRTSCVRQGDDVFEGGALAATSRFVYAAYRNATRNTVALYRAAPDGDFEPLDVPGVRDVDGDVALVATGSRVFLLTVTGRVGWLRAFDETTGRWEPPREAASILNRTYVPARGRRPALRVRSVTMAVLPGGTEPSIAIFFQRRVGSTRKTTLRGILCDSTPGGSCYAPRHLQPSNFSNNFLPAIVSVAEKGPDGAVTYRHLVSYWSDRGHRDGSVRLRVAEFDLHHYREAWASEARQLPCPILDASRRGDWGSSDASFVIGQGTENPRVYRAFTDSTQGPCTSRSFRADAQHVSLLPLPTRVAP